jgi:hypothetical protein
MVWYTPVEVDLFALEATTSRADERIFNLKNIYTSTAGK